MKMTRTFSWLSRFLCIVLIAAMALMAFGCADGGKDAETTANGASGSQNTTAAEEHTTAAPEEDSPIKRGEGATQFGFEVVDKDGNKTLFEIHTDKKTVGEALLELGLIEGENSAYGLYVKKVNGIVADYDVDGTYWAFYINDTYASTGVDSTDVVAGTTYSMRVAK